ncbi:Spo0E family sporulation regulatory protein-aspartic acid phosphatase [Clostridium sp. CX1]|uniref:Spo0E family sporulation regulatory protein-aspartic acid phosphatase n=1 Tax=Clostridium sp. CX1 TaxID=2978346 RepID=UPI0021C0B3A0|nr:Spo0E family sporulation regulatory protein-aspartic acid phosphatase [Clostridium sp. CX1]MCT8975525.1 Spo0E family sporulation regulatory protein-aspartic acid phosphatase [Clostridium sp. CX1]
MLEQLRQELYVIICLDEDLSNLSNPVKVAKSQELDLEINKEMYKKMSALKNS